MPLVLTHAQLVLRAERWLRNSVGCSVVLTELVTSAGEVPDAIGWKRGASTLVECKASVADFKRDADKTHHRAGVGMGTYRYYLTPPGLLKREDVPAYWGLLECQPNTIKVVKKATTRDGKDAQASLWRQAREIAMLVSALRRHQCPPKPRR